MTARALCMVNIDVPLSIAEEFTGVEEMALQVRDAVENILDSNTTVHVRVYENPGDKEPISWARLGPGQRKAVKP